MVKDSLKEDVQINDSTIKTNGLNSELLQSSSNITATNITGTTNLKINKLNILLKKY